MVLVNITDSNDNHPIFNVPAGGYMASLPENASIGREVITVDATDVDLGLHMEIRYSLNSSDVPFQISDPTVSIPSNPPGLCRIILQYQGYFHYIYQ